MKEIPIPTLHLFEPLEQKLIELLQSLSPAEWKQPTVARLWNVKDVAAHLLDTSIRTFAMAHQYSGDPPEPINSYEDLVGYLNRLNAEWVKAMKRVSPQLLIELLKLTQKPMIDYYRSLDPWALALFPVSWAGQVESFNWFHLAREYTERWHHQQQIRDAVHRDGIMERRFYFPMIDTFMQALPHAYRTVPAAEGTLVTVIIEGPTGGSWTIQRQKSGWEFVQGQTGNTVMTMPPDVAWKLFTKAYTQDTARNLISITGNVNLGLPILKMVSVMA